MNCVGDNESSSWKKLKLASFPTHVYVFASSQRLVSRRSSWCKDFNLEIFIEHIKPSTIWIFITCLLGGCVFRWMMWLLDNKPLQAAQRDLHFTLDCTWLYIMIPYVTQHTGDMEPELLSHTESQVISFIIMRTFKFEFDTQRVTNLLNLSDCRPKFPLDIWRDAFEGLISYEAL